MSDVLLPALVLLIALPAAAALLVTHLQRGPGSTPAPDNPADIAVGVVRKIADSDAGPHLGERAVTIDVETRAGQTFTGRLRYRGGDPVASRLRPGIPVLVAFDPAAREHLSLPDDIAVVRAAFDQMLITKGLLTGEQLELIRCGTRSRGVITALRPTGETREDYREVELDLMVARPGGGQFPAHEVTLVPASALGDMRPGSVVDTYYRPGDESTVTVCVSPI
jgi:hypothetical protein